MMKTTSGVLAVGLLALLWSAGAARSANPVLPATRQVGAGAYDDAAKDLGVPGWGAGLKSGTVTHVLFRTSSRREVLTVSLPTSIPKQQAVTWFGGLADALGWSNAELTVSPQPGATVLMAVRMPGAHSTGLAQFQSGLDLDTLQTQLRAIPTGPVLLAVRVGAEVSSVQPAPTIKGQSSGETFLFYQLVGTGAASGPLRVEYGAPRRTVSALLISLLLWLLFPPGVLFALREHLRKAEELDALTRLAAYRRWHRGLSVATFVGSLGIFFFIGFSQLAALGSTFVLLPLLLIFVPGSVGRFSGRLVGLPLEREAYPHRAHLPWYRMLGQDGLSAIIMCAVAAVVAYQVSSVGSGRPDPRAFSLVMLLPLAVVGLVILAALSVPLRMILKRRLAQWRGQPVGEARLPVQPGSDREELPSPVTEQLQTLVQKLATPVPEVLVSKAETPSVFVLSGKLFVTRNLVEALQPDQVAGLLMAAELARPKSRLEKAISWSWVLFLVPLVVFMGVMFSMGTSSRPGTSATTWYLPFFMFTWLPSTLLARYQRNRQEKADMRVAEALENPRRFLDALRTFEEFQVAALGTDPTPTRASIFSMRRTRLQKRLGLD